VRTLHVIQGGVTNGDKKWLEKAARDRLTRPMWVVPKSAKAGDDAVIYIGGYGLFATARIISTPIARADWKASNFITWCQAAHSATGVGKVPSEHHDANGGGSEDNQRIGAHSQKEQNSRS
jgi:hypothetical protein